ncbi:hypothetical protein Tco_0964000 [Tanacetum coccineum]
MTPLQLLDNSKHFRNIDNPGIKAAMTPRTAAVIAVYIDLIRSLNMRPKDVVKFSLWWSSDEFVVNGNEMLKENIFVEPLLSPPSILPESSPTLTNDLIRSLNMRPKDVVNFSLWI